MGYHVVDPVTLDPSPDHPSARHSISEASTLSTLAAAVYEMQPGEPLARTYHYHEAREELFYVLDGALTVETPAETYEVPAGSVFVAEPESPHRPHVPATADGPARVLGVGAPGHDPAKPYDPDANDRQPDRSSIDE